MNGVKPIHAHDCPECTHLGSSYTVDYYHCKQGDRKFSATLIARYSSEPSDYSSGMGFYNFTYHINVAGNLALDQRLTTLEELDLHCPVDVNQRIELLPE